jgi:hypothetical protein
MLGTQTEADRIVVVTSEVTVVVAKLLYSRTNTHSSSSHMESGLTGSCHNFLVFGC